MEAQGIISKVQQPTPWCAGMVVVNTNKIFQRGPNISEIFVPGVQKFNNTGNYPGIQIFRYNLFGPGKLKMGGPLFA